MYLIWCFFFKLLFTVLVELKVLLISAFLGPDHWVMREHLLNSLDYMRFKYPDVFTDSVVELLESNNNEKMEYTLQMIMEKASPHFMKFLIKLFWRTLLVLCLELGIINQLRVLNIIHH